VRFAASFQVSGRGLRLSIMLRRETAFDREYRLRSEAEELSGAYALSTSEESPDSQPLHQEPPYTNSAMRSTSSLEIPEVSDG